MRSLVPIVLSLSLAVSVARADVVPPPPAMCPRGTVPDLSHLGVACVAAPPASCPSGSKPRATRAGPLCVVGEPCKGEGTCRSAETCRAIGLCVATVKVPSHLGLDAVTNAVGVCGADQKCPEGSRCDLALRCEPAPPPPEPRRACQCASPGTVGADPRPGVAFTLAIGLALAWRRRR